MKNMIEFLSKDELINIYAGTSSSWIYVDGKWVKEPETENVNLKITQS